MCNGPYVQLLFMALFSSVIALLLKRDFLNRKKIQDRKLKKKLTTEIEDN